MLRRAKSSLAEVLSAFEFIDAASLRGLRQTHAHLTDRLPPSWVIGMEREKEREKEKGEGGEKDSIGEVLVLIEASGGKGSLPDSRSVCHKYYSNP